MVSSTLKPENISVFGNLYFNYGLDSLSLSSFGYLYNDDGNSLPRHYFVLRKLLPFKSINPDTDISLQVKGKILDQCQDESLKILDELSPRTCSDDGDYGTISAWEQIYGIVPESNLLYKRRNAVCASMAATGGLNRAQFYTIAKALDYNIYPNISAPFIRIIDNLYPPFRADFSAADVGAIYDQTDISNSMFVLKVIGTNVESDNVLQRIFNDLRMPCSEIVFENV